MRGNLHWLPVVYSVSPTGLPCWYMYLLGNVLYQFCRPVSDISDSRALRCSFYRLTSGSSCHYLD